MFFTPPVREVGLLDQRGAGEQPCFRSQIGNRLQVAQLGERLPSGKLRHLCLGGHLGATYPGLEFQKGELDGAVFFDPQKPKFFGQRKPVLLETCVARLMAQPVQKDDRPPALRRQTTKTHSKEKSCEPATIPEHSESTCTASLSNSALRTTSSIHRTSTNAAKALKTTFSMPPCFKSCGRRGGLGKV